MGNYRFRFSDMIPNAWFYKLRDMGRTRKKTTTPTKKKKQSSSLASSTTQQQQQSSKPKQTHQCNPRKSYYFTRDLNPTATNEVYTSPPNNPKFKDPNSPQSPRKSFKQRTKRRTTKKTHSPRLVTSSVSAGCNCRTTLETVRTKPDSSPPEYYYTSSSPFYSSNESESPDPEFRTDRVLLPTESSFDEMISLSNNTKDVVIDVDKNSLARREDEKLDERYEYDSYSEFELPPIITKKAELHNNLMMVSDAKKKETKPRSRMVSYEEEQNMKGSLKVKILKEVVMKEQRSVPVRGFSVTSPRVKIKVNSPRIGSRKVLQPHGRKSVSKTGGSSRRSLSDSFAIVKSSFNPQKDFRESMVEMIVENNIRASKDLEDLLACYLSLNSDEYHDLIINVFKQIWFDLTATR